ncbi:hypothetical protein MNBD_GAMMA12-567 [hydrothermal vent metagenome]|uniref:Thioredoxin domain-containing protein n=1 Tax=hydrothermal vent metagenome TaxID=652676 RepID=A0A3B0YGF1_9ZZZZ
MTLSLLVVGKPQVGIGYGQTAPEFSLTDLYGKKRKLSQLTKKGPVLLVFWSINCRYCHAMIPAFNKIDRIYRSKGLTLAAVNVGQESQAEIQKYARHNKMTYMILNSDQGQNVILRLYQLRATPTIKLVAVDGTIRFHGYRLPSRALLDAVLSE